MALLVIGIAFPSVLLADDLPRWPVLIEEGFDGGMGRWETMDPDPLSNPFWRVEHLNEGGDENQVLSVAGKSDYQPPHRSPHSVAILREPAVRDFSLTVDVRNLAPEAGPHRDLCVFWGFQDPAHFYYVHLGAVPDPHSCQIFIVDGADRRALTQQTGGGTPWTNGWHRVKVVRETQAGRMSVWFDDTAAPLLETKDKRFLEGRVGLGTFDDRGQFDNFVLRGLLAEPSQ